MTSVRARNYLASSRIKLEIIWKSMITVIGIFVNFKDVTSLPDHLRNPAVDSEQFRRELKTYLFAEHSKR